MISQHWPVGSVWFWLCSRFTACIPDQESVSVRWMNRIYLKFCTSDGWFWLVLFWFTTRVWTDGPMDIQWKRRILSNTLIYSKICYSAWRSTESYSITRSPVHFPSKPRPFFQVRFRPRLHECRLDLAAVHRGRRGTAAQRAAGVAVQGEHLRRGRNLDEPGLEKVSLVKVRIRD